MTITTETVSITVPDGAFTGYLARPASGRGAGVVVLQEIFGVNAVMRAITDDLAAQGYAALCPDLFWRLEPGVQLTDRSEAEWKQAFDLYGRFDVASGVRDIAAALETLRGHGACTGRVGAVGYCLGGLLAYLAATRTGADACVGYYGVNIQAHLDEADKISRPLLLHVAARDQFVPPEAQAAMAEALGAHAQATLHTYPEADHAFAREGGEHYDADAAREANARTRAFFAAHLKQGGQEGRVGG